MRPVQLAIKIAVRQLQEAGPSMSIVFVATSTVLSKDHVLLKAAGQA